jgi:hypothetical protein
MWPGGGRRHGRPDSGEPTIVLGRRSGGEGPHAHMDAIGGRSWGGSLADEWARWRPTAVAVGARAPAKGRHGQDNTRHGEVLYIGPRGEVKVFGRP